MESVIRVRSVLLLRIFFCNLLYYLEKLILSDMFLYDIIKTNKGLKKQYHSIKTDMLSNVK